MKIIRLEKTLPICDAFTFPSLKKDPVPCRARARYKVTSGFITEYLCSAHAGQVALTDKVIQGEHS